MLFRSYGAVKFVTSKEIVKKYKNDLKKDNIICESTFSDIKNINDYSKYMVYELHKHINTEYVLVIQYDGFVINPSSWRQEFLEYDYIGAPWVYRENAYVTPFGEHVRVGNGGFSLRSKKLLEVPLKTEIPFDCTKGDFYKHFNANNFNEDGCIAVHNRHLYEEQGCKFAPLEVAVHFSHETTIPENHGIIPFGFHGNLPIGVTLE